MKKEPLAKLPISFYEKEHKYIWDPTGDVMAYSVTQICGFDITDRKRDNIEATKHIWEPRGHTVHHCLEQYLLGEAQPDPGDYADWVEPLINHPFFTDFEPIAVEYRMCDLRRNIGGSLDALGFYKGKTLLVDLKTQSKVQSQIYSTDRQMGGFVIFADIENGGSGYDDDNPPIVTITGDGTGANATVFLKLTNIITP